MQVIHYSVLKHEVLTHLVPLSNEGLVVDCTLGEGGHTEALLSVYPKIRVAGIDRDQDVLQRAQQRLKPFGSRFIPLNGWFDEVLKDFPSDLPRPEAVLMDLGISMYHYEASQRGFSFSTEEQLDMRLDTTQDKSARDVINSYREGDLADVIYHYGEERYSRRIASAICRERSQAPIETARQLRDVIYHAVPVGYRRGRIHPATKTFQAVRIEVNNELGRLQGAVDAALGLLVEQGRLGIISFHSLEDRVVKHRFRLLAGRAPGDDPEVQYYKDHPAVKLITRKPIVPGARELEENQPSRSAKLRVAEKTGEVKLCAQP